MKRIICGLIVLITAITTYAQTQQGVVKTPTRRNVNGTWTKGQYIANATIGILFANNNAKQSYRSGNQGKFSFSVASPFYVTSVVANKGTYTFLDADYSKKQRKYSANEIEVLVDDPEVLSKVREEAIAYERGKIRQQIRAKEDEIENLKAKNKITISKYNKMLEELSEYRKSSEAIVQQIAEVYATTDFDKMDEFNQKLLAFVEEGNFASADSLLKTQGSKEEQFAKIKSEEAAIKKTEDEVNRAKEYNYKEKESLAQRLYSEHLMYLQKPLMQDSALYCLKLRADLDTTNVTWTYDYAALSNDKHQYDDAIKYYRMSARNALEQEREDLFIYTFAEIAHIYDLREQFEEELELLKELIHRGDLLNKSNPLYSIKLDFLYWQLANYYRRMSQFDKAAEWLKKCNDIERGQPKYTEVEKQYGRLENLIAIGNLYCGISMPKEALSHLLKGRNMLDSLYVNYPNNKYRRYELRLELNIGLAYDNLQEYDKALTHYVRSYDILKELYHNDPDTYRPMIAEACRNIGFTYYYTGDIENSIGFMEQSMLFYEEQHKKDPLYNAIGYCEIINNIGYLRYIKGDYIEANESYAKSASILHPLYEKYPNAYAYSYVLVLINQFTVYLAQNDLKKCGEMIEDTEKLAEIVYEQRPAIFARSIIIMYKGYAKYYMHVGDKEKAKYYLTKASSISPDDPEIQNIKKELEQAQ